MQAVCLLSMSGGGLGRTGGGQRGLLEEAWSKLPYLESQTCTEDWRMRRLNTGGSCGSAGGDPLHKLNWDLGEAEASLGGGGINLFIGAVCHGLRAAGHS